MILLQEGSRKVFSDVLYYNTLRLFATDSKRQMRHYFTFLLSESQLIKAPKTKLEIVR